MGFTSRAALLVLAAALVLCSGLASAARTKRGHRGGGVVAPASPPLDDEAGRPPAPTGVGGSSSRLGPASICPVRLRARRSTREKACASGNRKVASAPTAPSHGHRRRPPLHMVRRPARGCRRRPPRLMVQRQSATRRGRMRLGSGVVVHLME